MPSFLDASRPRGGRENGPGRIRAFVPEAQLSHIIDTLEKRCFSRRGMGCRAKIARGDFLSIQSSARTLCVRRAKRAT